MPPSSSVNRGPSDQSLEGGTDAEHAYAGLHNCLELPLSISQGYGPEVAVDLAGTMTVLNKL